MLHGPKRWTIVSAFTGVLILVVASTAQKLFIGASLGMSGYIVPVCVGIVFGAVIGWLFWRNLRNEIATTTNALNESEERYRLMCQLSPDLMIIHDGGLILQANQAAAHIFGEESPELLSGRNIVDFFPKQYRTRTLERVDEVSNSTSQAPLLDQITFSREGTPTAVELSSVAIPYKGKQCVLTVGRNITEQLTTKKEILSREALMQGVFRAAPVGIGVSKNRIFVKGNDRFFEMTGYSHEEAVGENSRLLYADDEEYDRVGRELWSMLKAHGTGNLETKWRKKDGTIIDVLLNATPLKEEALTADLVFIALDITDRLHAQRKVESEASRRHMLMDAASDGIAIIDNRHCVVEANAGFANMLGYGLDEVVGLHTWDWEDNFSEEKILSDMPDVSKVHATFETVHRRKDGSTYDAEVSTSGAMVEGEPMVLTISRDISERKVMEHNLRLSTTAAEKANRAKSEFLANMSHEIRTPLNGIVGMLQLLQMSVQDDEQNEFTENALLSGKRLTSLLSDILDASAIEVGKLHLSIASFQTQSLVDSVDNLFGLTAVQKDVSFIKKVWPGVPEIAMGDELRLRQVLFNLVGNGLKFTTEGTVCLDVCPVPFGGNPCGSLLFIVSDTGPGIPEDQYDTAFETFGQISKGYKRTHPGAGLGLPIVKRLVGLMGGTIFLDSSLGEGCVFYVSIPVHRGEHEATRPRGFQTDSAPSVIAHQQGATGLGRILLVEDERTNAFATAQILKRKGHEVVVAENGKIALSRLKKERFDVILMDVQMPVMDGIEATKAIRNGESGVENSTIPIIAVTAFAMKSDRETFIAAGMNDYISKPLEIEPLSNLLGKYISESPR